MMTSLTPADVELWLDDNADWLRDYLQRRRSITGRPASQSRHTVPIQSPLSAWHSRTHSVAVDTVSESSTSRTVSPSGHHHHHHHHQVQRGVTMPTRGSPDFITPSPHLVVVTSDSVERRSPSDATTHIRSNSKKHLRQHFARSRIRLTDDQFGVLSSETSSASFDWFVSQTSTLMRA